MLPCNGKVLTLPDKTVASDAEYIAIESAAGNIISIVPYSNGTINVGDNPEGFYVVRSLGRKGNSHRLGFFIIKRN